MSDQGGSEWTSYRVHILAEMQRLNTVAAGIDEKIERLHRDIVPDLKTRIALLEQRAAMWGALGGAVVSGVVSILVALFMRSVPP